MPSDTRVKPGLGQAPRRTPARSTPGWSRWSPRRRGPARTSTGPRRAPSPSRCAPSSDGVPPPTNTVSTGRAPTTDRAELQLAAHRLQPAVRGRAGPGQLRGRVGVEVAVAAPRRAERHVDVDPERSGGHPAQGSRAPVIPLPRSGPRWIRCRRRWHPGGGDRVDRSTSDPGPSTPSALPAAPRRASPRRPAPGEQRPLSRGLLTRAASRPILGAGRPRPRSGRQRAAANRRPARHAPHHTLTGQVRCAQAQARRRPVEARPPRTAQPRTSAPRRTTTG